MDSSQSPYENSINTEPSSKSWASKAALDLPPSTVSPLRAEPCEQSSNQFSVGEYTKLLERMSSKALIPPRIASNEENVLREALELHSPPPLPQRPPISDYAKLIAEHPTKDILCGSSTRRLCRQPGYLPTRNYVRTHHRYIALTIDQLAIALEALDRIVWLDNNQGKCDNSIYLEEIRPDSDIMQRCVHNLSILAQSDWRNAWGEFAARSLGDPRVTYEMVSDAAAILGDAQMYDKIEDRKGGREWFVTELKVEQETMSEQVRAVQAHLDRADRKVYLEATTVYGPTELQERALQSQKQRTASPLMMDWERKREIFPQDG